MKLITELKQVGQSEKYKLFVNGEFAFFAALEVLYKNNIKKDTQINDEKLEQIKFESDKIFAFASALEYSTKSLRTKKQIGEYLYKKGYNKQVQNYALEKLEGYGYLNDLEYAKRYVEQQSKTKGVNLIKKGLYEKGVSQKIADQVLHNFTQTSNVMEVAQKYLKNKELNQQNKQKLYRHLLSRGYTYSEASSATSKLFSGDADDWY